ncbi:MAG TPA: HAD-IA family hydrolase [Candidatus Agrococcus pullicola]|uniref:HAD-IA family hydrolase n=1 Tax=Candidatus Agrococcus pullicola TaxID=2838429 RepID=A0A9D1YX95_9MICO|nr:HAD-IA family hydrolase [Candidatus Agrococcus pullicola]
METTETPVLSGYDGYLFDLDGVLTPTASVHMLAWRTMFSELFAQWGVDVPYSDADYFASLDGKKRYEGVQSLLATRDIELPYGSPDDDPGNTSICAIGNLKNVVFLRLLELEPVAPYVGSVHLLNALRGSPLAVVSSSKNAEQVLVSAGLRDRFAVVVDGSVAEREHIPSKPAPDMFRTAAERLGADPAKCVAFEDALSGVASARSAGVALVVGVDRGVGEAALLREGAHIVVEDLDAFL